jgi:hypothetical protein
MKWDIDKALRELEGPCPGTTVSRVLMSVELLERNGIKLTPKEINGRESVLVWCLQLGVLLEPKVFIYSMTIRGAYLRARKVLKANKEAAFLANLPPPKKRKPHVKQDRKARRTQK